ncbi:MAG: hypothetical protein WCL00_11675 [Bacteroidota bacterium]
MNNRNTIIGFVLIFAILIGYSVLISPSKEDIKRQERIQDSIAQLQQAKADSIVIAKERQAKADTTVRKITETTPTTIASSGKSKELHDQLGAFALSAEGKKKSLTIENEMMRIRVSTLGGKIEYVELKSINPGI